MLDLRSAVTVVRLLSRTDINTRLKKTYDRCTATDHKNPLNKRSFQLACIHFWIMNDWGWWIRLVRLTHGVASYRLWAGRSDAVGNLCQVYGPHMFYFLKNNWTGKEIILSQPYLWAILLLLSVHSKLCSPTSQLLLLIRSWPAIRWWFLITERQSHAYM